MGHTSPDIKRPEKPLRSLLLMVRTQAERRKALQRGKLSRATAAPATTPTSPTSPTPPFLPRAHVSSSLTSASRRAHSTSEVLLRNACVSAQEAALSQISASNAQSSAIASYLESAVGMKRRRASDVTSNSFTRGNIDEARGARPPPSHLSPGRLASSASSESLESSLTRANANGRQSSHSRSRLLSGNEDQDDLAVTWNDFVLDPALDPAPSSPPPPKRQRRTRSLGPLMSSDTAREIKERRRRGGAAGGAGGAAEMETEETRNMSLLAALDRARA